MKAETVVDGRRVLFKIGSNFYTKEKYTEEQAIKAAETLVNCRDCIDCVNCTNCRDCVNCTNCRDCEMCIAGTNLRASSYCVDCTNCTNCRDCVNCTNCELYVEGTSHGTRSNYLDALPILAILAALAVLAVLT